MLLIMVHIYVGLFQLAFHKISLYYFPFCQSIINLNITVLRMSLDWAVITPTSLFPKSILSLLSSDRQVVNSVIIVDSINSRFVSPNLTLNAYIIFFV